MKILVFPISAGNPVFSFIFFFFPGLFFVSFFFPFFPFCFLFHSFSTFMEISFHSSSTVWSDSTIALTTFPKILWINSFVGIFLSSTKSSIFTFSPPHFPGFSSFLSLFFYVFFCFCPYFDPYCRSTVRFPPAYCKSEQFFDLFGALCFSGINKVIVYKQAGF